MEDTLNYMCAAFLFIGVELNWGHWKVEMDLRDGGDMLLNKKGEVSHSSMMQKGLMPTF